MITGVHPVLLLALNSELRGLSILSSWKLFKMFIIDLGIESLRAKLWSLLVAQNNNFPNTLQRSQELVKFSLKCKSNHGKSFIDQSSFQLQAKLYFVHLAGFQWSFYKRSNYCSDWMLYDELLKTYFISHWSSRCIHWSGLIWFVILTSQCWSSPSQHPFSRL